MISWKAFNEESAPELVRYVQDRDLWQWKLPHSKGINNVWYIGGYMKSFENLEPLYSQWSEAFENFIHKGKPYDEYNSFMTQTIAEMAREKNEN